MGKETLSRKDDFSLTRKARRLSHNARRGRLRDPSRGADLDALLGAPDYGLEALDRASAFPALARVERDEPGPEGPPTDEAESAQPLGPTPTPTPTLETRPPRPLHPNDQRRKASRSPDGIHIAGKKSTSVEIIAHSPS